MTNLNDDIIGHIMMCFEMDQVKDCFRLALTCGQSYSCLQKNKVKIDDHFIHITRKEGSEVHRYGNMIHRDNDKPAVLMINETRRWYQYGKLHRDGDKPAVIYFDGEQQWYHHGERHRDGDLPAVIWPSGSQEWYQHNERHRDGDKAAVICVDGSHIYREWYKHGVRYLP